MPNVLKKKEAILLSVYHLDWNRGEPKIPGDSQRRSHFFQLSSLWSDIDLCAFLTGCYMSESVKKWWFQCSAKHWWGDYFPQMIQRLKSQFRLHRRWNGLFHRYRRYLLQQWRLVVKSQSQCYKGFFQKPKVSPCHQVIKVHLSSYLWNYYDS